MDKVNRIIHSKVFKNGVWLSLLQMFNTIAPMLTIPYITRVLGASKYGTFSIALNLIHYFQVIVEYGFAMSGARKIALNHSQEEINKTYTSIFYSRVFLTIVSALVLLIFIAFGNYNNSTLICLAILYIIIFSTTIQLTWLFQGLQDMRPVTIVSMISRIISLILIFWFVKSPKDLYLYCLLYGSTNLIYGIVGQFVGRIKYGIRLCKIKLKTIKEELIDGWYLFTSSAMSKIFGNIGITILGLVSTEFEVGVYSAVSKITTVAIMMFLPVSQALFPHVSRVFRDSAESGKKLVNRIALIVMGLFTCGSLLVFILRDTVVNIAFGSEYKNYSLLLLPLLIWMLFSILNNFLGVQILVASGRQKQYSRSFLISIAFLVVYNLIFVNTLKLYGVAIAQALSEITLSVFLAIAIRKSFRHSDI